MSALPPRHEWVSPSLAALPGGKIPAHEMKFLLCEPQAQAVEVWATERLTLDPHADPAAGNRYRVTSLYFDTTAFDVYRRAEGYRLHKHRVRRYGTEPIVHLERKSKRNGQVWKCRSPIALDRAGQPGEWDATWFAHELTDYELLPVCRVTYERTAFVGSGPTGPVRVTLDREAVGAVAEGLAVEPVVTGLPLLREEVVVEFKFLGAMPPAFKDVIETLKLTPSRVSKYRRCAASVGLVQEGADA